MNYTFRGGCFTIIRLSSCLSGFYLPAAPAAAAVSPLLRSSSSSKFMQHLLLSAEQQHFCSGLLWHFCCCSALLWHFFCCWMQSTIGAATFCWNLPFSTLSLYPLGNPGLTGRTEVRRTEHILDLHWWQNCKHRAIYWEMLPCQILQRMLPEKRVKSALEDLSLLDQKKSLLLRL